MQQVYHAPSATLPGPATAPGAQIPPQHAPIPMQQIANATTPSASTADQSTKRAMAWKYEGYQAFSRWMASDDDFFVFRRFESLNANTILWMQDKISRLEEELQELHRNEEDAKSDEYGRNDSFRFDETYLPRRDQIMCELSRQLQHYNQFIDAFGKIRVKPRATKHQITNVENWLHRGAIESKEAAFVKRESDLISIHSRPRPPLLQWLESFGKVQTWGPFKAKIRPDLHVQSTATKYSSNEKFDTFGTVSVISMGLIMLLAPLWWLNHVSASEKRLGIITVFLVIFVAIMSTATIHRPFEVVAASAAYAAVLMVFMQIQKTS